MKKVRVNITQLKEIVCTEYNKFRYGNFLNEAAVPIARDEAIHKIMNSNGAIFTVNFTKKDGTDRIMNCRLGVKKHLKGGSLPYDAVEKGLIPVFDMQIGNYRMVNVNSMNAVRINGENYIIQ